MTHTIIIPILLILAVIYCYISDRKVQRLTNELKRLKQANLRRLNTQYLRDEYRR